MSAGEIKIDGRPVSHLPPAERELTMVFLSQALYPHMSVHENMAFGLRHRKLGAAEPAGRCSCTTTRRTASSPASSARRR